jgi:polysaccharide biosynthesis/export protein
MVSEFMQISRAKLILFAVCAPGMLLLPALAQTPAPSQGGVPIQAAPAADNRVGAPVDDRTGAPVDGRTGASVDSRAGGASAAYAPATTTMPPPPANSADPANYVLGPEDNITVSVFGADDINARAVTIANDGNVNLPMVGKVHAGGLTVEQFQTVLYTAYQKFFKEPQVTVQVTDSRSQPVSVAGNVNTPGMVQLRGNRNLLEVISLAGGLRADAGDSVLVTRNLNQGPIPVAGAFTDPTGQFSVAHINVRQIMAGTSPQGNIQIKPHDVITVPRARMIYVLGNVGRPGGYVLTENESMSITQAIALAGGWSGSAKLGSSKILRASGGAEREEIPADIKKIMANKAPDLQLRPDDILYVPNSFGKALGNRGLDAAIGAGAALAVFH